MIKAGVTVTGEKEQWKKTGAGMDLMKSFADAINLVGDHTVEGFGAPGAPPAIDKSPTKTEVATDGKTIVTKP